MIVNEVLVQAAYLLGKTELADRLLSGDVNDEECQALLRCYNLVEGEIALNYLPLTAEQTVDVGTMSELNEEVAVINDTEDVDGLAFVAETENGEEDGEEIEVSAFEEGNEIAVSSAEKRAGEEFGKIYYSSFMHSPLSVLRVTDVRGEQKEFKLYPDYLQTDGGTIVVTYTYSPEKKSFSDRSAYADRTPVHLLAFGVVSEYCLINGLYEEALLWDRKFKDGLLSVVAVNRPHIVRPRRWV